jgi:hypothetical protein
MITVFNLHGLQYMYFGKKAKNEYFNPTVKE